MEVMEVVGVEGSRVLFERYLPLHDTVLKRYRVARGCDPEARHLFCGSAGSGGTQRRARRWSAPVLAGQRR